MRWRCARQVRRGLMKLKHLEMMLSQVAGFEEPKWALEQYATPVHFASRMLQVGGRVPTNSPTV